MNAPFLAGMFTAWAAAQIAIGVFFMMASAAHRGKDREYFLFGLVCFALAGIDAGFALTYFARDLQEWRDAARVVSVGGAIASALNAHFILAYTGSASERRSIALVYGVAALFLVPSLTDRLIDYETLEITTVIHLGNPVSQVVAMTTPIGSVFCAAIAMTSLVLIVPLVRAYRAGKREAMSTLVAFSVTTLFVCHDVLVAAGKVTTTFIGPYGYLIYGFGVANTLLMRYRRTTVELEGMATELSHATDELTSSYLELGDVQEELFRRRQLASVGELAASIAHEVRNPLAIIQNAAANLKRTSIRPQDRETLFEIIEEEIRRLNGLVTELLRFARPVNVERSDIALADLFKAVASGLSEPYRLDTSIPDDAELASVWADPALLRLAIDNLVDNSCQAMPKGGAIRVDVTRGELRSMTSMRIEIRDEGAGMADKTLERAADPFFTTRPKGTGLGLPIAQRIVEAHDGRLEIESTVGRGTKVTLELPLRRRESMSHMDRRSDAGAAAPGGAA